MEFAIEGSEKLEKLKEMGEESGFLTPDDIMSLCERPESTLDDIEEILDTGVDIVENAPVVAELEEAST